MKKFTVLLLSAFLVNACAMDIMQSASYQTAEYMQTADAVADAKKAIESGNFNLLGFDQRGLKVPGVKNSELASVQKRCNITRLDGMGDVIRSEQHHTQMKNIRQYSLNYNLVILKATSCKK